MKNASLLLAAALFAIPAHGAVAQEATAAVSAKPSQVILDADGRKLGKVYQVSSQGGYVSFISGMQIYRVPMASLSAEGARLKTTMTKKELGL